MDRMLNVARREAERVLSMLARPKCGVVTAYDPANYAAKVTLQPEGVETGWIPVRTPWAGNGWGVFCPPTPGDEVEIQFQEAGKQAPYVALRAFGDRFRPLSVPSGEFWIVHKSGSSLEFHNDGSVSIVAATVVNATATQFNLVGDVVVTGTIRATGDITDRYESGGYAMASFRATYDSHTHPYDDGDTGVPHQVL